MDVILLERVEHLGQMGQIVSVRPGYARNYLLPQKKAMRATKENRAFFETQKTALEAMNLERRKEAEYVGEKLDGVSLAVIRQAGESGVLYGSVSARDIASALDEVGFKVARSQVSIDQPIKTLGLFQVRVILHPEVNVSVTVNVARSTDEAELQAKRGGMVSAADLVEEELAESEAAQRETEAAPVSEG